MNNTVIKAENLAKAYQLGEFSTGTLSRDIERWWALMRGKEDPFLKIGEANDRTSKGGSDIVWSLRDINFEIDQGDSIGIIGRNGAGKSTLLKVLSRVTTPTAGGVKIKGRIASLLEVGTGFHPELTGRENIFLNGAILGMRKAEIRKHFDAIVDFAGIERYIDTPVKRYSSGMYVRLAFAVAAHLESEILIVDEVLAVGDAEFQRKCLGKMSDVSTKDGRTVLFVSHNMQSISTLTNNCIYLKQGLLVDKGPTEQIISTYLNDGANIGGQYVDSPIGDEPKIVKMELITSEPGNTHVNGAELKIIIDIYCPRPLKGAGIALEAVNIYDQKIMNLWNFDSEIPMCRKSGITRMVCTIPTIRLYMGNYHFNVYLAEQTGAKMLQALEKVCAFEMVMLGTHRDYQWQEGSCTYIEDFEWDVSE
ncbi:MAG: polysaccharide ABC transporter ATP-binding protein [Mucilaginibacter sp.]|uniref:ABC transporter ATP-binding protein n=1 Tax=Mucilaginibacter sp. TaxID=1882438 RepID=UPI003267BEBC